MVSSNTDTCDTAIKHRIRAIWAINFQSHKKSKIILSDGITGLIGTNDVGKTALSLRVLNLLRFNRPVGAGTRYIRDGEKKAIIGVEFGDGSKVIMHMFRKGSNKYIIKDPDGTKEERKVIGNNVPEEVIAKFGNFGEINLQTQRETAYFILDTSGKIAQLINMTKGIGRVDKVISKIKIRIGKVDDGIENTQDQIVDVKAKLNLKRFRNIEKFQNKLGIKLRLLDKIKKIRNRNGNIVLLVRQLADVKDREQLIENKVIDDKKLNNLDDLYSTIDALDSDTDFLKDQIDEYNNCIAAEEEIVILSKEDNLFFVDMLKLINDTKKLEDYLNTFLVNHKVEKIAEQDIKQADSELKVIFDKLDICPLCNTVLKRKK